MHITLSLDLSRVHLPLDSLGSIASKRAGSKDTDGSATGEMVERVSASLLIYEDTKIILDKDINLKWQEVNDAFVGFNPVQKLPTYEF